MFNKPEMSHPKMTLELRIEPLIKTVVHEMLLSEEDCQAEIEAAVRSALSSFNWREKVAESVRQTFQAEMTKAIERVFSSLTYDARFIEAFRKSIISAMTKEHQ